jgi:hypothetical protein
LWPQDGAHEILKDMPTCAAQSFRDVEMIQRVNMFHKRIIFMKNGRKALIDLPALIDLQVADDLKFMLQVDYISFFAYFKVIILIIYYDY